MTEQVPVEGLVVAGHARASGARYVSDVQPATVIVSLPVTDLDRSLRFYRDGLDLPTPGIDEGIIAFELPNLSLFLIETSEYDRYVDRAGVTAPSAPAPGACIFS